MQIVGRTWLNLVTWTCGSWSEGQHDLYFIVQWFCHILKTIWWMYIISAPQHHHQQRQATEGQAVSHHTIIHYFSSTVTLHSPSTTCYSNVCILLQHPSIIINNDSQQRVRLSVIITIIHYFSSTVILHPSTTCYSNVCVLFQHSSIIVNNDRQQRVRLSVIITIIHYFSSTANTYVTHSSGKYCETHEETCLWGLRPGKTQTGLLSYRDKLGSWYFGCSK